MPPTNNPVPYVSDNCVCCLLRQINQTFSFNKGLVYLLREYHEVQLLIIVGVRTLCPEFSVPQVKLLPESCPAIHIQF
jgi:hypothetical protein